MKRVSVRLTPEADEVYEYLLNKAPYSKQEEAILNAFLQKVELIKNDVHYGNPLAKRLIPSEYKSKYGVKNLFRVEFPGFWRVLYKITNGNQGVEILVIVIDILDHKKYDKIFGYKK
jgi:mRNA-degrading endonuclease RelE of RelBE toxin-antitoxin system